LKCTKELSASSIYRKIIPACVEDVSERLLMSKEIDQDMPGLMGLIMLGGIGAEETQNWLDRSFSEETFIFHAQQNLSALLFGITYDQVSTELLASTNRRVTKTNAYVCLQRTRFLEPTREVTANKRAFGNKLLRKGAQKTTSFMAKNLRYVAIEVMFRLMMMMLQDNEEHLFSNIEALEPRGEKAISLKKTRIKFLLKKHFPQLERDEGQDELTTELQYEKLEKMTGHDLMVTSIMSHAKALTFLYAKNINDVDWNDYMNRERIAGREIPERTSDWPKPKDESTKAKVAETTTRTPAKTRAKSGK
jgi:hypothetical protein